MKYVPQSQWTTDDLKYWREGTDWCCAVPRNDFATQKGFSWKKYGIIGKGKTRKDAMKDWESWLKASNLVADIY